MNFFIFIVIIIVLLIIIQTVITKDGRATYQFVTKRAGHGSALGTIINTGEEKDIDEKEISKKLCSKDDKKGHWICNKITYNDGRKRTACGCVYDIDDNNPNNILTK
jgi:hypothetical protein